MANLQRSQVRALEKVAILAAEMLAHIYEHVVAADMPPSFVQATEDLAEMLGQASFHGSREFTAALLRVWGYDTDELGRRMADVVSEAMEEARNRLDREAKKATETPEALTPSEGAAFVDQHQQIEQFAYKQEGE